LTGRDIDLSQSIVGVGFVTQTNRDADTNLCCEKLASGDNFKPLDFTRFSSMMNWIAIFLSKSGPIFTIHI